MKAFFTAVCNVLDFFNRTRAAVQLVRLGDAQGAVKLMEHY